MLTGTKSANHGWFMGFHWDHKIKVFGLGFGYFCLFLFFGFFDGGGNNLSENIYAHFPAKGY